MHAHASCITLAEGHFRLKSPPPQRAPDGRLCGKRESSAWLGLALQSPQDMPRRWRNRPIVRGIAMALLLHMLCFSLLMEYAYHTDEQSGLSLAGERGGRTDILMGHVALSRLSVPGPPASQGGEAQAQMPPVPSVEAIAQASLESPERKAPQKLPVEEKMQVGTATPVPLKTIQPKRKKAQEVPRQTQKTNAAAEVVREEGTSGAAQGGQNAARTPDSGVPDSGSSGAGSTGGGAAGPGALAVFGGRDGPSFKHFTKPEYPAQARRQGITGKVLLRVHITAGGVADRVEVVQSAHEMLSKSALEAVNSSTFHPMRRNGKSVSCWTLLPISFTLDRI